MNPSLPVFVCPTSSFYPFPSVGSFPLYISEDCGTHWPSGQGYLGYGFSVGSQ